MHAGGGYFVVSPYVIPNLIRSALEPPNRGLSTLKKSALIEIGGETTKPQPLEGGCTLWRGVFCGLSLRNFYHNIIANFFTRTNDRILVIIYFKE